MLANSRVTRSENHFLETTKMVPLGSGFEQVLEKAVTSCQTAGYNPSDHFAEVSKMIPLADILMC